MPRGGNPNPSPATRFRPGQSGNPGGMSAALRRQVAQNAERAVALAAIGRDVLTLLRDAEHRGLGAPVQPQEHGCVRVVVLQPGSDEV